jgi:hypothetical protein
MARGENLGTWTEKNGIIRLSPLISNGRTGKEWSEHFKAQGLTIAHWTKQVLLSDDFKPTTGVTYNIAVIKGWLFSDHDRHVGVIRSLAGTGGFVTPNAEVACLIRAAFSDSHFAGMDINAIVTMHEPISNDSGNTKYFFCVRGKHVDHKFGVDPSKRVDPWNRRYGFAFAIPKEK